MGKKTIDTIKKDFSWAKQDSQILSVLLFGSVSKKENHRRSDIDIAIVIPGLSDFYFDCKNMSHKVVDASKILRKTFRKVNTVTSNYDVHIFEELPVYIQMNIIKQHKIIYTRDKYGMYEYFFHYRKLWDDQKHRNTMSKEFLVSTF
jgi:uncharacterized protein